MSTRATYEIAGMMFYVHHDGYAAGAASYFANMIGALTVPQTSAGGVDAIEQRRGGPAFAFIRGNVNAEPTESHQAHGDTEYRWRVSEHAGELVVAYRARRSDIEGLWSAWSTPEPLATFINRYWPGAIVAIEHPSQYMNGTLLARTVDAIAIAAKHRQHAAALPSADNPNHAIYLRHAEAWERGALEQIPRRCSSLEKLAGECEEELRKIDERGSNWGRAHYVEQLAKIRLELQGLREPIGELAAA